MQVKVAPRHFLLKVGFHEIFILVFPSKAHTLTPLFIPAIYFQYKVNFAEIFGLTQSTGSEFCNANYCTVAISTNYVWFFLDPFERSKPIYF
jgi:hypothetical protein